MVEATTEVAIEGEGATHRGQPVGANHRRGPQLRCSRSRYTMAVEMAVDTHAQSSSSQDRARITLRSRRRLRCGRGVRGGGEGGEGGEGGRGVGGRGASRWRAASVEPSYLRGGGRTVVSTCIRADHHQMPSDAIRLGGGDGGDGGRDGIGDGNQARPKIERASHSGLAAVSGVGGESGGGAKGAKGAKGEGAWEGEAHRGGGRRQLSLRT